MRAVYEVSWCPGKMDPIHGPGSTLNEAKADFEIGDVYIERRGRDLGAPRDNRQSNKTRLLSRHYSLVS